MNSVCFQAQSTREHESGEVKPVKGIVNAYTNVPLILRIVIGLAIGVILALVVPNNEWIAFLGTMFTSALKAIAPILVFFLVMGALSTARSAGNMKTVIILYIASTVVAGILAVIASFAFPSELVLTGIEAADTEAAPEELGTVITTLLLNGLSNPIGSLASANYLGILVWAVLFGIALRHASDTTKNMLQDAAKGVTVAVRWVIECAPFGILGLIYASVSETGMEIFTVYGHLVLVLVVVILVAALVTNPILVAAVTRSNPFPLVLRCLKDSAVMAFFTRSSAANIPVNMKLCEDLGLDKDNYSVSIPLGATINMAGACITITIMTMACCNTLGITVDPVMAVILCVLSAVSACGASGVAGGSLLLIPLACSLFNIDPAISAQVIGVGFIIGVIQDSCETALNSSSDVVFTAAAELRARRIAGLSTTLPIPVEERTNGLALDSKASEPTLDEEFAITEDAPSAK